jgi:hypothetical protein
MVADTRAHHVQRLRDRFLSLALAAVGCAPSPPEPRPPITPPPPATVVAKPRAEVRWIFGGRSAMNFPYFETDLGSAGVLQGGGSGKRWLLGGNAPTFASQIAGSDLHGVIRDGESFAFVGKRGDVFISRTALGPFTEQRFASFGAESEVAIGKSLLVLDEKGKLHRSSDLGKSWSAANAPLPAVARIVSIAGHRNGDLLVLAHPQRILRSSDGGSTWTPVMSAGEGAGHLGVDAAGEVWLMGSSKILARYEPSEAAFKIGGVPLQPKKAPTWEDVKDAMKIPPGDIWVLGDRLVAIEAGWDSDATIVISSLDAPGTKHVIPNVKTSSVEVFRDGAAILISTGRRVLRTTDSGATFTTVAETQGQLWIRDGLTLVSQPYCKKPEACAPSIRSLNGAWKELPALASYRIRDLAVDAVRKRLFIYTLDKDGGAILSVTFDGEDLRSVPAPSPSAMPLAFHVARDGGARLYFGGDGATATTVVGMGADGSRLAEQHIPLPIENVAFAGARALAHARSDGWESADDGVHWTRVAIPERFRPRSCEEAGCSDGTVVRVGWQLEGSNGGTVAVVAGPAPVLDLVKQAPAITKLKCTANSKWSHHALPFSTTANIDGDTRAVIAPDSIPEGAAVSALAIRGTKPQLISLLPAKPKTKGIRTAASVSVSDAGIIARRATMAVAEGTEPDTVLAPSIDLELAWWTARDGGMHSATVKQLPKPKRFRFNNYYASQIVEGGAVARVGDEAPLTFIGSKGPPVFIAMPPAMLFSVDVLNLNGRFVVRDTYGHETRLASTGDLGKTWTTATWTMGGYVHLGVLDGVPMLIDAHYDSSKDGAPSPRYIQPVEPLGYDPPSGLRAIDFKPLATCASENGLFRFRSDDPDEVLEVTFVDGDKTTKLTGTKRVLRLNAKGSCVAARSAHDNKWSPTMEIIVTPRDLAHAWVVRRADKEVDVRPASCVQQ